MKLSLRPLRRAAKLAVATLPILCLGLDASAQGTEAPKSTPLTIDQCVEIALQNNPGLAIARSQLTGSEGNRQSAFNAVLPSLAIQTAGVSATSQFFQPRINEAGQIVSGADRVTSKYYSARSTLTQNLITPSYWYRFQASGSDVAAARQGLRASRAETIYQVRQGYLLLIRAILLEQVTAEALQVSDAQATRSKAMFDVGSVARSDVLQSSVNRASAERDEINARNAIEQQRALLASLMGLDPQKPLEIQTDLPETPTTDYEEPALIQEAVGVRPEVLRARAQVRAAQLRHRSAFWNLWPYMDGTLFWQRQEDKLGKITNLSQVDRNAQWGVSIGLTWNVFDGLASIGSLKTAKANVSIARESQRQEELNAAVGIREALVAIKNAREGMTAAEEGVTLAEENLRLQQALYENGGGTILDLNTAQAARTKARIDQVDARISLHLAVALLDRAVGAER